MISEVSARDLGKLLPLWKQYAEAHAVYDDAFLLQQASDEAILQYLSDAWMAPGHHVFICSEVNQVVGFVHFATADFPFPHRSLRHGFIDALYVHPSRRLRGIGSMLFKHVNDWLAERSIHRIQLCVAAGNAEAYLFWKKFGFDELVITMKQSGKAQTEQNKSGAECAVGREVAKPSAEPRDAADSR